VGTLLVDGALGHEEFRAVSLRSSLAAIWEWINQDLLPMMTGEYVSTQMRPLIAADDDPREMRKATAAFSDQGCYISQ